jgi:hypothetical protein
MPTFNLKKMTTPELWAEFRRTLATTAEGLRHLAVLWCELKNRGEDMSGYHNSFTSFLPAVAAGKLHPEALILFNPVPALLDAVQKLVPEEQARLVQKAARLPVRQQDGTTKDMRPIDLSGAQIRQVFGDGMIRTPAQQKRYMPAPKPVVQPVAKVEPVALAPRRVVDHAHTTTQNQMLFAALGLTPSQRLDLQSFANKEGMSCAAVLVNLAVEHGLIRGAVRVSAHKRAA